MTILELCERILELKNMIKSNERFMKSMIKTGQKEMYENAFAETVSMIDELVFYENQLDDIEKNVDVKVY